MSYNAATLAQEAVFNDPERGGDLDERSGLPPTRPGILFRDRNELGTVRPISGQRLEARPALERRISGADYFTPFDQAPSLRRR